MPMGLKCAPDFAQEFMENVLRGIEDIDVYLDDVGCFPTRGVTTSNFSTKFCTVWKPMYLRLTLVNANLQYKKLIGLATYWLTPRGLKPWKKKIEAILQMDRPRDATALRGFIGAVNFTKIYAQVMHTYLSRWLIFQD